MRRRSRVCGVLVFYIVFYILGGAAVVKRAFWGGCVAAALFLAFFVCVQVFVAQSARAEISLFQTPELITAVTGGDLSAVKALLVRGEAANSANPKGQTALMLAVNAGNEPMARLLLENGALVNLVDRIGNGALHWAVERGDVGCVALLLGVKGVKVDIENRQGVTALMMAARDGQYEIVDRLLRAGARTEKVDFTGRTASDWAKDGRNSRVLERLR
ncbi:hypothetical protein CCP2SC5_170024 [Azospirillaceae bacterium]